MSGNYEALTLIMRKIREKKEMSETNETKNPSETPSPILASICLEVDKLRDLLVSKNRDYGASAFESPSLLPGLMPNAAILVRMSDKINRLQTLSHERVTRQVASETFDDTIRDLAGYCILYLAAVEKEHNETVKN